MKNEEIKEGNKLIADFMELNDGWVFHEDDDKGIEGYGYTKYHESWDWLMKVVENIESQELQRYADPQQGWASPMVDIMNRNQCEITWNDESIVFVDGFKANDSKINVVWLASVEFIKWLNKYFPK